MLRKLVAGFLLFLFFVLLQMPAGIWDQRLRVATDGSLALLDAHGSAWEGTAILGALEPGSGRYSPVTRLSWAFRPTRLVGAKFVWEFSLGQRTPFPVELGISGIHTQGVSLQLPARFALSRIPNAAGHAGWHGEMALSVPTLDCNWRGVCDGHAQLLWNGAAADLFPGMALGDYVLDLRADKGAYAFTLHTQRGEVRINGAGTLTQQGALQASGTVEGDPDFVGKLPNVAGRWVQREDAGRYRALLSGSLDLFDPCHLDGFEDAFAATIRVIVEFRQGHYPFHQVDEVDLLRVDVGMRFRQFDGDIKGVSPFHFRWPSETMLMV